MDRKCHRTITDWLCTTENTRIISRRFWERTFERKKIYLRTKHVNMLQTFRRGGLINQDWDGRHVEMSFFKLSRLSWHVEAIFLNCWNRESRQLRQIKIEMSQHVKMSFFKLSRLTPIVETSFLNCLDWDNVKNQDFRA
jgi:hypothetical protein